MRRMAHQVPTAMLLQHGEMNQNVAHCGIIGNEKPKPPGYVEPFDDAAINLVFQRRFRPETLFPWRRDIFVARRKLLFSTHYLGPPSDCI